MVALLALRGPGALHPPTSRAALRLPLYRPVFRPVPGAILWLRAGGSHPERRDGVRRAGSTTSASRSISRLGHGQLPEAARGGSRRGRSGRCNLGSVARVGAQLLAGAFGEGCGHALARASSAGTVAGGMGGRPAVWRGGQRPFRG